MQHDGRCYHILACTAMGQSAPQHDGLHQCDSLSQGGEEERSRFSPPEERGPIMLLTSGSRLPQTPTLACPGSILTLSRTCCSNCSNAWYICDGSKPPAKPQAKPNIKSLGFTDGTFPPSLCPSLRPPSPSLQRSKVVHRSSYTFQMSFMRHRMIYRSKRTHELTTLKPIVPFTTPHRATGLVGTEQSLI